MWGWTGLNKCIVIAIIIIIIITTFVQSFYNYSRAPDTNHISRVYSFEAILNSQFLVPVLLLLLLLLLLFYAICVAYRDL